MVASRAGSYAPPKPTTKWAEATVLLNVPTLFVALFAAFAMFGVILLVARRSLPDCPDIAVWAQGTWLTIAGFALLVSRAVGPAWVAVIGGNGLLFVGLYLNTKALHGFVLGRAPSAWQYALMVFGIVCTVLIAGQSLPVRTSVISLLYALQILPMVHLVVTRGWRLEPSLRTIGIALGLTDVALIFRAVHATLHPAEYGDYFQASLGNGVTYLVSYLFPLGAGIGFILANLERTAAMLRAAATHDSLTGCINRGPFESMLQNALARARRENGALSLLLMDLDHFKAINDAHGHQAGDEVLRRFAQTMRARLRSSDILGRVGGEEFAVVLPGTGASGALSIAEQLRAAVQAQEICARDGARIALTVSIGVATLDTERATATHEALYRRADEALYAAKLGGRNRTIAEPALGAAA